MRYKYDIGEHESPSTAIVEAVHTVSGVPIEDLPPLGEHVSASALNELSTSLGEQRDDWTGEIKFEYCGLWVTVEGAESISLRNGQLGTGRP